MSSDFSEALLVSVVGMFTVFVILSLVIISGQLLIKLLNSSGFVLNKMAPKTVVATTAVGTASVVSRSNKQIYPEQGGPQKEHPEQETIQAIELAIQKWSNGTAQMMGLTNLQTGEKLLTKEGKSAEDKAIEAAIQQWSQGKASIRSIRKMD